jgi:hypothetical protein
MSPFALSTLFIRTFSTLQQKQAHIIIVKNHMVTTEAWKTKGSSPISPLQRPQGVHELTRM